MLRRGPIRRPAPRTFEPTDLQKQAIEQAEAEWRELQAVYSEIPDDPELRTRLKGATRELSSSLGDLLGPQGTAVRAAMLAKMQELEGLRHAQHVYVTAMEKAFEVILLMQAAAAKIAPAPGPKAPVDQVAFIARAAAYWRRDTGESPTAKGAFLHAIHACAQHPALRSLTPGRVDEALKRLSVD